MPWHAMSAMDGNGCLAWPRVRILDATDGNGCHAQMAMDAIAGNGCHRVHGTIGVAMDGNGCHSIHGPVWQRMAMDAIAYTALYGNRCHILKWHWMLSATDAVGARHYGAMDGRNTEPHHVSDQEG